MLTNTPKNNALRKETQHTNETDGRQTALDVLTAVTKRVQSSWTWHVVR
jgi:hypothetical protein